MLKVVFSALISYLLGSFPTCYLVIKQVTGDSIFELGDGNMGGTNVFYITGSLPITILAGVGDVLKAYLSAWLSTTLLGNAWMGVLIGGVFSTLGHNYSIFMNFKGGKGGSTTIGSLLYATPYSLLIIIISLLIINFFRKWFSDLFENEFKCTIVRILIATTLFYSFIPKYAVHSIMIQLINFIKYLTNKEWDKKNPF